MAIVIPSLSSVLVLPLEVEYDANLALYSRAVFGLVHAAKAI
jgi:hypothetical protein